VTIDDAYRAGKRVFSEGKGREDNPYACDGMIEATRAWRAGYDDAAKTLLPQQRYAIDAFNE